MPVHPHTGKPRLSWGVNENGVHTAYVERMAKYKTARTYTTRETLAMVRPTYNGAGVLHDLEGVYVVVRNAFEEVRSFDDLETAKIYVESLFALEYGE